MHKQEVYKQQAENSEVVATGQAVGRAPQRKQRASADPLGDDNVPEQGLSQARRGQLGVAARPWGSAGAGGRQGGAGSLPSS